MSQGMEAMRVRRQCPCCGRLWETRPRPQVYEWVGEPKVTRTIDGVRVRRAISLACIGQPCPRCATAKRPTLPGFGSFVGHDRLIPRKTVALRLRITAEISIPVAGAAESAGSELRTAL